jgi:signal peptide peptidase SppA
MRDKDTRITRYPVGVSQAPEPPAGPDIRPPQSWDPPQTNVLYAYDGASGMHGQVLVGASALPPFDGTKERIAPAVGRIEFESVQGEAAPYFDAVGDRARPFVAGVERAPVLPTLRPLTRVLAAFLDGPWCVHQAVFDAICEVVERRVQNGVMLALEQQQPAAFGGGEDRARGGSVAVIQVHGVMSHRIGSVNNASTRGVSTEAIGHSIRAAAADPQIRSIILDIDSPGGRAAGTPELAALVRDVSRKKRVVAAVSPMAASAAYWLASQASEIVVTPSGSVGSIGVLAMHVDETEKDRRAGVSKTIVSAGPYKAEGYGPLTDEALAHVQESVNDIYRQFVADVAIGRGIDVSLVEREFGQGRMVTAQRALRVGMVDRIASLDEVISGELSTARTGAFQASANEPLVAESASFDADCGPTDAAEDVKKALRERLDRLTA